jgi:hypothetical protein
MPREASGMIKLLTANIHSGITVTSAAAQRFPAGFDDRDIAILQWIAAEGCRAVNSQKPATVRDLDQIKSQIPNVFSNKGN